eukprot:scaffold88403_cov28-Tisochrysis_lutea.AAC.2
MRPRAPVNAPCDLSVAPLLARSARPLSASQRGPAGICHVSGGALAWAAASIGDLGDDSSIVWADDNSAKRPFVLISHSSSGERSWEELSKGSRPSRTEDAAGGP